MPSLFQNESAADDDGFKKIACFSRVARFSGTTYRNEKNIPNIHKVYPGVIKYTK
jgi:hypothetical protein